MAYSKDFRKKVLEIMALESLRVVEWLPPYSPDLNPIEHKLESSEIFKT
jgi:transposase